MPLSWENKVALIESDMEHIRDVLDPNGATRAGMAETPLRAAKAMVHYTAGYDIDPASLLKTFEDGSEGYDEMVTLRNAPFYSLCEHHMAPFFGTATIAYIPKHRIVGISKLQRVLTAYSRRFQVQERITVQIANLLEEHLKPKGVAVMLTARHFCMEARGVERAGVETVTTHFKGAMKEDAMARQEFMATAK